MKLLLLLLFSVLAETGCSNPTRSQGITFVLNDPIVTYHCDLDVDGVCYDHTDGQGHIVPLSKEEEARVSRAIEQRACTSGDDFPAVTGNGNTVTVTK